MVDNKVRICTIQSGPASNDIELNLKNALRIIDDVAKNNPDFILISELFMAPYFCGVTDFKYFDWAETIPGRTTELFAQKAKEYNTYIILPIFEVTQDKQFYNSAVVVGPEGIVPGVLPNGKEVNSYRKVHIPDSYDYDEKTGIVTKRTDEKFYFSSGEGFPVFNTNKGRIGILICYDKRFTEAWRTLALNGAQIIFNPIATWGEARNNYYMYEMMIMALYNQVFSVGVGKSGIEVSEKERVFGSGSYVFDPFGRLVSEEESEAERILTCDIDISLVHKARTITPIYRDRSPKAYSSILGDNK